MASDELNNAKEQLDSYKDKALAYNELILEHEKQQQDLATANSNIQKLEYEISTYNDWKEIMQV